MGRPTGSIKTPSYRRKTVNGHTYAVVTLSPGKDTYLGEYDTPVSREKYNRLVSEWFLRGRQGPAASGATATVAQVAVAYMETATRTPGVRRPTNQVIAMRWLTRLYGSTGAAEFGAAQLEAIRREVARTPVSRRFGGPTGQTHSRVYVNELVCQIKLAFKVAHTVGVVPASVWHSLLCVELWKRGKSPAVDRPKVKPADLADVHATLEVSNPTLAAIIELQLLTGARCGELLQACRGDIDMGPTSDKARAKCPECKPDRPCYLHTCWVLAPRRHKTMEHGIERLILLGPQAQGILRPFMLRRPPDACLFSPAESERCRCYLRQKGGKFDRVEFTEFAGGVLASRDYFTASAYNTAIMRACQRADRLAHLRDPDAPADQVMVRRWHSHQLRHARATYLRAKYGLDVARVILGHTSAKMTEHYAVEDRSAAMRAMSEVG